jgi:hypothetical protein
VRTWTDVHRQPRPTPPPVPVEVVDGLGLVEICGDGSASMLKLVGEPAMVDGSAAQGSWLFARALSAPGTAEVKALADLPTEMELTVPRVVRPEHVPGPRTVEISRTPTMRRLLQLLPSGGYLMSVLVPDRFHVVKRGKETTHVWDVPGEEDVALVATDPWPGSERAEVTRARARLAEGSVWPAVLAVFAAPESMVGYVVDGHHSLAAYVEMDVPPTLVCLVPSRQVPPHNQDVRAAVPVFVDSVPESERHSTLRVLDELRWLSLTPGTPDTPDA